MSGTNAGTVDARYLERAAVLLAAPKQAGLEAAARPGGALLDVGCGPGIDTVALARLAGPASRVDGVDADPAMIGAARARAESAGLADRVRHHVGRADALPFADASFDAVRAERLLQHVADPAAVVTEMGRVAAPDASIVLVDTDWASLSITGDRAVERRLVEELQSLVPNPTAGRDLRGLLVAAGCRAVEVQPFVVAFTDFDLACFVAQLPYVEERLAGSGRVAPAAVARWHDACARLDTMGAFYGHAVMTVATGRWPR